MSLFFYVLTKELKDLLCCFKRKNWLAEVIKKRKPTLKRVGRC